MEILALASWDQGLSGTEWSTIADLNHHYLYISIDHNFDNIVRTDLDNYDFRNFGDINIVSYDIQDEYGNGVLEQGEGIIFIVNLTADFDTPGLIVTLSSDSPGINVINPVHNYGELEAQYELSYYENPFLIELPETDIPSMLSLSLECQTSYGYTMSKTLNVFLTGLCNDCNLEVSEPIRLNCYPNPISSKTFISFEIKNTESAQIEIFNLRRQKVASFDKKQYRSGKHEVLWNAKDQKNRSLPSGIYFIRFLGYKKVITKKVILLK
ncbi:MAG TPA: T9SS type A sorting domain-containing protein [Candidatus Cloacimonadota bacterium]|nr:T9SS type A sorting domain-containing protein [Candidatus Cloacimonadota bacterium]